MFMAKQALRSSSADCHSRQRGFTLVEVVVAVGILIVILAGMSTAVTASMRLNVIQKERAQAQDLVRDVMGKYVKSFPFDDANSDTGDLTPFDNNSPATYVSAGYTQTVYDAAVGTDNLDDYGLDALETELKKFRTSKLELIYYPIKKNNTEYYTTKLNLVVKLSWNGGGRSVEIPSVVGEADVTRADRAKFKEPAPPLEDETVSCAGTGVAPTGGISCCSGLSLVAGICTTVSSPTCTPVGDNISTTGGLACCSGSTDDGTGLCVANSVCTPSGENRASYSNAACCSGSTDDGTGLCTTQPTCASVGTAPSTSSSGTCCSTLKHNTVANICITCISAGTTPPNADASLCCSGNVQTNGNNAGQCKNN
ncbi:MAG: hypothetical protein CVV27_02260 [Candidatus Melainabacteria bacterium HGW-Melainabacteria-1]|nr:MAG: hypothetical protein CVV27_02260 [Candidatus Melainabacteria bacterium HGW-Melainabacteria-1]